MSGTEVLGRVAAKLLELELHEAAETSETPLIRVRNYEPEEVEAIVSNLAGMTLPGREDPVNHRSIWPILSHPKNGWERTRP